jgi:hypothetical protein
MNPVGLWYTGFDRWRNSFAEDVGDLLAKTSDLISGGHPKFSHIPKDLPRIGLILTMEPFPFIDARLTRNLIGVTTSVPMRVCSINDLEWLVCLPDRSVGEHLFDLMTDPARKVGTSLARSSQGSSSRQAQCWIRHGPPPTQQDS